MCWHALRGPVPPGTGSVTAGLLEGGRRGSAPQRLLEGGVPGDDGARFVDLVRVPTDLLGTAHLLDTAHTAGSATALYGWGPGVAAATAGTGRRVRDPFDWSVNDVAGSHTDPHWLKLHTVSSTVEPVPGSCWPCIQGA